MRKEHGIVIDTNEPYSW